MWSPLHGAEPSAFVPFPNCRSGVTGLALAGNPKNDGHLSPWQEAVGHEVS
jgi:hypothetical protein